MLTQVFIKRCRVFGWEVPGASKYLGSFFQDQAVFYCSLWANWSLKMKAVQSSRHVGNYSPNNTASYPKVLAQQHSVVPQTTRPTTQRRTPNYSPNNIASYPKLLAQQHSVLPQTTHPTTQSCTPNSSPNNTVLSNTAAMTTKLALLVLKFNMWRDSVLHRTYTLH